MRISDWSSDVCSSDLTRAGFDEGRAAGGSQPLFYHYLLPLCPARAKRRARGTSRAGSGLLSAAMRRRVHSHERSARCAVAHPAADRVFVSIVIANYNYARFLRRCRSEEHTSELQSLMRISYAVFCLKKTKYTTMQ